MTPSTSGLSATESTAAPLSGTTRDPAASVSKLGYVEFTTPDLDRLIEYYTNALCFELVDRTADQAYLTTGFDHHCVVLNRGEAGGRTTVGYEVADSLERRAEADQRRRLRGLPPQRHRSEHAGRTGAHRTRHRTSRCTCTKARAPAGWPWCPAPAPPSSATWPPSAPAWTRSRASTRTCWASAGPTPSATSSCSCAATPITTPRTSWRARSSPACTTSPTRCATSTICRPPWTTWPSKEYRLHWGPGRHGPGHNIFTYHRDPDGNIIELFTQLDVMYDESQGLLRAPALARGLPAGPEVLGGRHRHRQLLGAGADGGPRALTGRATVTADHHALPTGTAR